MKAPDPFDSTRTIIDRRRSQAQAQYNLSLAGQSRPQPEPARPWIRFAAPTVMLLAGAILLAMGDLMEIRGRDAYAAARGAGWLLWLASFFVVRPRSWRIPIYLVCTYVLVAFLSFSMYPVASIALNPQSLSAECRGWEEYRRAMMPILDAINTRDASMSGGRTPSDTRVRTAISDTEALILELEALDPPGAMDDYHDNLIDMQRKWIDVYRASLIGQPVDDMLLDLHDDWVLSSYMRDQGNDKCAAT